MTTPRFVVIASCNNTPSTIDDMGLKIVYNGLNVIHAKQVFNRIVIEGKPVVFLSTKRLGFEVARDIGDPDICPYRCNKSVIYNLYQLVETLSLKKWYKLCNANLVPSSLARQ